MSFLNTSFIISLIIVIGASLLIWISRDSQKSKCITIITILLTLSPLVTLSIKRSEGITDNKNELKSITLKTRAIIESYDLLISSLESEAMIHSEINNLEDIKNLPSLLPFINPNALSNYVHPSSNQRLNWIQAIHFANLFILKHINILKDYMPYMDTKFQVILSELEDSFYTKYVLSLVNRKIGNDNLVFLQPLFDKYAISINKLRDYYENNLKVYDPGGPAILIQPR